jgi:hypothetical protein
LIQLKKNIKIRNEEGFFLVVNLTTEDMLNGYPAFFQTNRLGKIILDLLAEPTTIDNITKQIVESYPSVEQDKIVEHAIRFVETLSKYSLITEL